MMPDRSVKVNLIKWKIAQYYRENVLKQIEKGEGKVSFDEQSMTMYARFPGTVGLEQIIKSLDTLEERKSNPRDYKVVVEGREITPQAEEKASEISIRRGIEIKTEFVPDEYSVFRG